MGHPSDSPTFSPDRKWEKYLLILSLAVYLAVRLVGLADFPIYFFTDEAAQTVLAADLAHTHYRGYDLELLPAFFAQGGEYKLGASVYLQLLPFLLFGKSLFVTRAAAVLASTLAPLAVALALRYVFKARFPWLGILILSALPAWFLHSRTAFETALAAAFFALFLLFYLLYRTRSPAFLFPALTAAALTCYSYPPAQLVTAAAALFLLLSDLRYHWLNRRILLGGLLLALLLAAPYARFLFDHPGENLRHLQDLGSYWTAAGSLPARLLTFARIYLQGLDPLYWFFPNPIDIPRHSLLGYGNLGVWSLPFVAVGLGLCLRRIRQPAYRVVLLAILAAPAGAALVEVGITRVLPMLIPAALLAAIGLEQAIVWLAGLRLPRAGLAGLAFAALVFANGFTAWDALVHGPTWYSNYGLTGMQYGAGQVFAAIRQELRASPGEKIVLSPTWTNGADVVARFFLPDPLPIEINGPRSYTEEIYDTTHTLFVMTAAEYDRLPREKFASVRVEQILPYPNGLPGFYFVRLQYVDAIRDILSAEAHLGGLIVEEKLPLGMQMVDVFHTRFESGALPALFDGDPATGVRAVGGSLRLEFDFQTPLRLHTLGTLLDRVPVDAGLQVWYAGSPDSLLIEPAMLAGKGPFQLTFPLDNQRPVARFLLILTGSELEEVDIH